MTAAELLEKARPLLEAIKANQEHGRALALQRAEFARSFRGELPPGVAEAVLAHHAIDYRAPVFGLLLDEIPPDLGHQIKEHVREHDGRAAVHAGRHGAAK